MQYSLIGNVIVEVLGGIFFFIAAIFVIKDRLRVHDYLASKSGFSGLTPASKSGRV